nr:reverse transcriptase [Tanacetum cinerariifolium]
RLLSVHLFYKALMWHRQLLKVHGENVTWPIYRDAIIPRFDTVFDDPMVELKNVKYTSNAKEYQDKFDDLLSRVEVSVEHSVSLYLGRLPTELEMEKEYKEKRPKNLYFYFDKKYVSGHKCEGHLFTLVVLADQEEQEEEFVDANENLDEIKIEEVQPQMSLNALSRVNSKVAKRLGCAIWPTCPLTVNVTGEKQLLSVSECKGFTWKLKGETFVTDVMLLPLGGCDMVLGIQWLSTLGDIKSNFKDLRMEFVYNNKKWF